jgi:hypothetical protein
VIVLTPVLGAAARASSRWVSLLTTFEPMSPVPPITTTFMTSPFVELFAVRPTSRSCGKCRLWVISGHDGLHQKASALPLNADILRGG